MCVMTLHNESKSHENPPQIDPFQIEDWNCDCFSSKWGTLAYSGDGNKPCNGLQNMKQNDKKAVNVPEM